MRFGDEGVIRNVESHGSNPWTRYSIVLDSGLSASGIADDQFEVVS